MSEWTTRYRRNFFRIPFAIVLILDFRSSFKERKRTSSLRARNEESYIYLKKYVYRIFITFLPTLYKLRRRVVRRFADRYTDIVYTSSILRRRFVGAPNELMKIRQNKKQKKNERMESRTKKEEKYVIYILAKAHAIFVEENALATWNISERRRRSERERLTFVRLRTTLKREKEI